MQISEPLKAEIQVAARDRVREIEQNPMRGSHVISTNLSLGLDYGSHHVTQALKEAPFLEQENNHGNGTRFRILSDEL